MTENQCNPPCPAHLCAEWSKAGMCKHAAPTKDKCLTAGCHEPAWMGGSFCEEHNRQIGTTFGEPDKPEPITSKDVVPTDFDILITRLRAVGERRR